VLHDFILDKIIAKKKIPDPFVFAKVSESQKYENGVFLPPHDYNTNKYDIIGKSIKSF
jgi:hypothetical protein